MATKTQKKPAAAAKPKATAKKAPAKKADPLDQIAKLGWEVFNTVEPRVEVSPYAHKYERAEAYVTNIAGDYRAHKRVGDVLLNMHGESPEQLLAQVTDWEAHEVPRG